MEKKELEQKIAEIKKQYQELVFESFDSSAAWKIGTRIRERALAEGMNIAASVTMNRKRLFYMAMEGTSPINERWISRKENTVYTFFESSYEMSLYMKLKEDAMGPRYGLKAEEYAAAGGGFPIIVKDSGIVGSITVSGLTEEEDHALVVNTIREYLKGMLG